MKYTMTIEGDPSQSRDRRVLRELMALLHGSTATGLTADLPGSAGFDMTTSPIPDPNPDDVDDDEAETLPVANVAPGEVDSSGLPWDARIHSGKKSKTETGTWRKRKGIGDDYFKAIEAELRARGIAAIHTGPTPVAMPSPTIVAGPTPTPTPVAMPTPTPVAAPAPVPTPAPMPTPVPTPAPAPVASSEPTFQSVMFAISQGMTNGTITNEYLSLVAQRYGLANNFGELQQRTDLVPQIWAQLQVDGKV